MAVKAGLHFWESMDVVKGKFSEKFLYYFIVNSQSNALKVCKEFFVKIKNSVCVRKTLLKTQEV